MTLGPLEYIVIGFEGDRFDGSIAREIGRVVENGTIRIVDAVFIAKDEAGDVAIVEIDGTDDPRFETIRPLLAGTAGLLTPEDVATLAESIRPSTAALALLFEHRWTVHIKEAMEAAGGFLVGRATIPPEVLEELSSELEAMLESGSAA
jgi:hypothetical protein